MGACIMSAQLSFIDIKFDGLHIYLKVIDLYIFVSIEILFKISQDYFKKKKNPIYTLELSQKSNFHHSTKTR